VFDSVGVSTRKLEGTDGFVVTDLGPEIAAAGVLRSAPKVLADGAAALARSQTYQFASFERRSGGASAAVNATPDARAASVAAAIDELVPEISAGLLLLEPARGVEGPLVDALRAHDPRPASYWEHRHELRAVGVATAVAATGPVGRVAIEGFDDAGPALVAALVERGATVVAIGTASGTAIGGRGLDPSAVAEAWAAHGADLVGELGGSGAPAGAVFLAEADVLVAGSKVGIVDHALAAELGVRAVVPGGALPVTAKALASLRRSGVVVLPDFVTTAGPLFAWPEDGSTPTPEEASTAAAAAIESALADVAAHPAGPVIGACERAEAFLSSWATVPFGRPLA
jgi:glutamate dehydrogenase/leucine dehydrogenase